MNPVVIWEQMYFRCAKCGIYPDQQHSTRTGLHILCLCTLVSVQIMYIFTTKYLYQVPCIVDLLQCNMCECTNVNIFKDE